MKKSSAWRKVCIAFMFCAATAIASPAQTFTKLLDFNYTNGAEPSAVLIQGADGNFYGTTYGGGANTNCFDNCGTVFKITPEGTLTTLHSFDGAHGSNPYSGLVQGSDGNFYGVTFLGGSTISSNCPDGCGTVFKMTPDGTLTMLHSFDFTDDGAFPNATLVQASDGNFYGTTSRGANPVCAPLGQPSGCGTVFKITPGGSFSTLHSFTSTDGSIPYSPLVQGADGALYGTTNQGGANDFGTVFKITLAGTLTTLHSFGASGEGDNPVAGLTQALNGNFYGTTLGGGYGYGTVFEISPGGALTTLHRFGNSSDGKYPSAGLVQASDGSFYGVTQDGGSYQCHGGLFTGCGTIFNITADGVLTTVHSFQAIEGKWPSVGLMQGTNGNFYGGAFAGGANNLGTVYGLAVGLTPFVETQPTSGSLGAPVVILGTNLTGATSVTFNGTAAAFSVVSPSEITTNVPAGATTGTVQVTTLGGTLSSNLVFQVILPLQFVPVTPCRVVDTRNPNGPFGGPPIQGGTYRSFPIPQGSCSVPTSAAAYSLNVTVLPSGQLGYLTIWPTGEIQPYVSTMNSLDGRIKANAAIVPAGTSGAVSVFVTNTANVVLDIDGYFAPVSGSTLAFYPLTPCRIADTRNSSYPPGLGPPYLPGGQERAFPILSATSCNIPSSAAAYSLNFSVVPHGPLGYLTVWPTGQSRPLVSTLNDLLAQIIANAAIVPAGTSGEVSVYPSSDTDLIIDINGYFAAQGTGGLSLYPTAPCRVIDTRHVGSGQPFSGTLTPPVDVVDSACGPPATAQAYVFNATVLPTGALGYLTLWSDGQPKPLVSTLNALDGSITNNMAIVPTTNGKVDAYASGLTQLILDISSYFAP